NARTRVGPAMLGLVLALLRHRTAPAYRWSIEEEKLQCRCIRVRQCRAQHEALDHHIFSVGGVLSDIGPGHTYQFPLSLHAFNISIVHLMHPRKNTPLVSERQRDVQTS
ncbi:hypothetical protein CYMTET_29631, partial [Cymbomonas tetramitiformis]